MRLDWLSIQREREGRQTFNWWLCLIGVSLIGVFTWWVMR